MPSPWFTGKLLVASPTMETPEFARSVILMLHHDDDGGHGIVLNRPMDAPVAAALPPWQELVTPPQRLFQGGPVGLDTAVGLISVPGVQDAEPLGMHLLFGGVGLIDLDIPPEVVAAELGGMRVFVGYSGWTGGQLESEVGAGDWLVVEAEPRDGFTDTPELLWETVLRRQPPPLCYLLTYPANPVRN